MRHASTGDPDTGLGATPLHDPELRAALLVHQEPEPVELEPVELFLEYDPTVPVGRQPGEVHKAGVAGWFVAVGLIAWGIHAWLGTEDR